MGYHDDLESEINELKYKVIDAKSDEEVIEAYKNFKYKSVTYILNTYTELNKDEVKETYYYDVLDRVLWIEDDDIEVNSKDLLNFLKFDKGLVKYCEEHLKYDGITALLKYKNQIRYKKELIKEALLRINQYSSQE
jgi:hypothetical protein